MRALKSARIGRLACGIAAAVVCSAVSAPCVHAASDVITEHPRRLPVADHAS